MNEYSRHIQIVIVDDEEPSRNELRYLLEQHSDVQILGEGNNAQEAMYLIARYRPQVVFLDIEMPGMNGLQLAEEMALLPHIPLFVFSTAHEEFALKAFEIDAVDYILKPFGIKRVNKCIEKIRMHLQKQFSVKELQNLREALPSVQPLVTKQKLAVEQNGKMTIIHVEDILMACCSTEKGQIEIHTQHKKYYMNISLNELQNRLGDQSFFRSHRAYLVNIEKIREVIPWFNGTYNIIVDTLPDFEIPVSRQQACKLRKILGI